MGQAAEGSIDEAYPIGSSWLDWLQRTHRRTLNVARSLMLHIARSP
jgi:hypothetical protein